jgi:FAD/FMN-containing dehydrogenase
VFVRCQASILKVTRRETGLTRRELLARGGAFAAAALALPYLPAHAEAQVDPRLHELDRSLRGPLFLPGSQGYALGRAPYNARYGSTMPLAVARPRDAADVRALLRWSARTGVPLAARSGGHSYAGYSTTRGVVVALSSLGGVALDAAGNATIGPGARLIDVYTRLAARGRAIPAGSCPTVGIGGLTLGGGFGLASRAWGLTCDNLVRLEIVTVDGRVRVCDAKQNADLFWACRGGGGGNFGIVTRFVFRTHQVRSGSYFIATWPWHDVAAVVDRFQQWAPPASDALGTICRLATGATEPSIQVFGQYLGSKDALERVLGDLTRDLPSPTLTTGAAAWLDLQLRWAGCLGKSLAECRAFEPTRFAASSDYFAKPLSAAGIARLRARIEARQGSSGAALLDAYGGAVNRVSPAATAFAHRRTLFSCQYFSAWSAPADDAAGRAWIDGFRRTMRPFASGAAYQNYIDPNRDDWKRAYYGTNPPRLVAVKRKYDPGNVLRFAQSVPLRI